jgi:hypothetical protein
VQIDAGEAETDIGADGVSIRYGDKSIQISYRDILSALAENYRVKVGLRDGTQAEFYYLGHNFDSFSESFFKRYNAVIKTDSFMGEEAVCVKRGACFEHAGSLHEKGECDLYLGRHALIVQRVCDAPARLPYALIDGIDYRRYNFSVDIYGDRWSFSMLGHEYDGFQTQYAKCYKALVTEASGWLQSVKSDLLKAAADNAAVIFLDGRPDSQAAADKSATGLWRAVFDKACEYGGTEYFGYLRENASKAFIGFKDSLHYAQGSYIWMMAHIGRYIVFEAASSSDAGMATYIYRIKNSADYTMRLLNYCMHMTEFRREPVYLSDDEFKKPENSAYLDAVQRVPQIGALRAL